MPCDPNYPNTVADVAQEIINDLDADSSLSVSYVSTWLRDNVGKLNNAVGSNIVIGEDLEFSPCLSNDEKDIFKWLFTCRYYANLVKNNLGAAAYDWSEMREGDSVIRKVSVNEIAKTYALLAKQCEDSLKEMIKFYRMNKALPRSQSSFNTNMWLFNRTPDGP